MSMIAESQRLQSEIPPSKIWKFLPYFVTLSFTSFYFLNAARLDPEPHHDGYMLATAIASRDGFLPHSGYFDQYGPVSSYLLGLTLKFGFGPLLTIRLVTAITLILSALLIVAILAKVNHPVAGMIGVVLWSSTSADWTVTYNNYSFVGQWPWSNVVFNFFALIFLFLFLQGVEYQQDRHSSAFILFVSGFSLSIAIVTRLTIGIVLALGFALIVALSIAKNYFNIKQAKSLVLGTLSGLLSFILILKYLGLIGPYRIDTISGPASATSPVALSDFIWRVTEPALGALLAILILGILHRLLNKFLPTEATSLTLTAAAITSFMFAAHQWLRFPKKLPTKFFVPWGKDGLFSAQVNVPLYLAIIFVPMIVGFMIWQLYTDRVANVTESSASDNQSEFHPQLKFQSLVIGIVATCLLIGAYPIADLLHIWWSTPLALAFLIAQLSKINLFRLQSISFCLAVIFPFVMIGTTNAVKQNNVQRVTLDSPALKGMLVTKAYYYNYKIVDSFMYRHADKNVVFMCDDGLLSVWNNRWQSAGPDFVSWSWGNRTSIRDASKEKSKSVIFCSNDTHETSILARSLGLTITDIGEKYVSIGDGRTLSGFSNQYLLYATQVGSYVKETNLYDHPS